MIDRGVLRNCHVLVVEDEPLVAMALVDDLEHADAFVVGPASSIDQAIKLINSRHLDAAILDLDLQGQLACVVADLLMARGVPFIITTGHDMEVFPPRFAHIPNCPKPALAGDVVAALIDHIAQQALEGSSTNLPGPLGPGRRLHLKALGS